MPWHRSVSNPRKVYNERHEQVCICETPEQAALIVEAVRAFVPTTHYASSNEGAKREVAPRNRKKTELDDDGSFAIV
jgi:hypothetical protein